MTAGVFRWLAISIAVVGVVDPAVTLSRPAPAIVAVLTPAGTTVQTSALADRVARSIGNRYQVTRSRSASAAAVVAIGDRLLDDAEAVIVPSIAVLPDAPAVRIASVTAPARASLADRVTISTSLVVTRSAGRTVDVTLRAGNTAIDRASQKISSAEDRLQIPLMFVPASEGPTALTISARLDSSASADDNAVADIGITIDRQVWPALVFSRRPSWMSTFVDRVLEDDPRFAVTSRTVTSPASASTTSDSPASLADAALLARFAVIVVGAPEALTDSDVAGLDTYLRRRGGAVVALFDSTADAKPRAIDRLLNVHAWRSETSTAPVVLTAAGLPALETTETLSPSELPRASESVAGSIVWQLPVGAGRVVVSGALDSWRYRESTASGFRAFWRRTIATAANASPGSIDIAIDRQIAAAGVGPTAIVTLRELALSPDVAGHSATVAGTVDGTSGHTSLRLWPDVVPGQFRAMLPASSAAGVYRMTVTSGADNATASWIVVPGATAPNPDERALVEQWAHSRGGTTISASTLGGLPDAIDRVLSQPRLETRWHVMRQPWWIVPFALLLGCEWWLRRRR